MPKTDRLQGTLSLLILRALKSRGPLHGYGITLLIESIAGAPLKIEEGSLYPALHRMEQDGFIHAEWGTSENNRRARYYSITASGRKQLEVEQQRWAELSEAVSRVLRFA